jgi:hypothetical protein
MDSSRLRQGEQIAAVSAVALFIFMFFDWFGIEGFTADAWESFEYISSVLSITIAATLGVVAVRALGRSLGDIRGESLILVLGAISTILVLYRIINPIDDTDRKIGLWLGLIAAAGIAVGGYLASQAETLGRTRERFGGDVGRGAPPSPPPPPPTPGGRTGP